MGIMKKTPSLKPAKTVTVNRTTTTRFRLDEDQVAEILRLYLELPLAQVDFDTEHFRGVTITTTSTETEEVTNMDRNKAQ